MRLLRITLAVGIIFIPACLILTSCSSKEITRERAADLIRNNENFKEAEGEKLLTGNFCYDWRNLRDAYNYTPLESSGLLRVNDLGDGGCGSMWLKRYNVELTSRGVAKASSWTTSDDKGWATDAQNATTYFIPTANKELVEVTGITKESEGNLAEAEFTWKWAPTDEAETFGKTPTTEIQQGRAALQLYDDGWRVVDCCSSD
jgi:hypothetical protein